MDRFINPGGKMVKPHDAKLAEMFDIYTFVMLIIWVDTAKPILTLTKWFYD